MLYLLCQLPLLISQYSNIYTILIYFLMSYWLITLINSILIFHQSNFFVWYLGHFADRNRVKFPDIVDILSTFSFINIKIRSTNPKNKSPYFWCISKYKETNMNSTLHEACQNTRFLWTVFSHRFCSSTGKSGSENTCILTCFIQWWWKMNNYTNNIQMHLPRGVLSNWCS